jgi:uncharacterized protein (TIGR02145 family)
MLEQIKSMKIKMKQKKVKLFAATLMLFGLNGLQAQTIKDIEGNIYNTVTIGTQVWMKENLNVTKYNDGTDIPVITDSAAWVALNSPGMCWHDNDKATYTANKFGALYNWNTVGTGKLCPTGWHVSTNEDWVTLIAYLGEDPAGKLKETEEVWQTSYIYGSDDTYDDEESYDSEESEEEYETEETYEVLAVTNESGFSALPGGYRDIDNTENNNGEEGDWWCSEARYCNSMRYDYNYIRRNDGYQGENLGASVRCVKD